MTRHQPHCILRHRLAGMAALLLTLAMTHRAAAAISGGPKNTNAAVAEQQRDSQFYLAEQSYQEKLNAGRRRYEQKQTNRAKIIAGMSAELQARQKTVVIQPAPVPDGVTDEPDTGFQPSLPLMVMGVIFIGFGYSLRRLKRNSQAARSLSKNSPHPGSRPFRPRYKVTALKPVVLWANVEISKVERTALGAKVRRTKQEPGWIQLKDGETRDQLSMVVGIHPGCVPNGKRIFLTSADADIVPLGAWTDRELPMEFFDYFKLEVSN